MINFITWVLTVISLIGNYLNCRKIRICFIVWILCNIGWLIFDLHSSLYSRVVLDAVQTVFSIYGYINWGKGGESMSKENGIPEWKINKRKYVNEYNRQNMKDMILHLHKKNDADIIDMLSVVPNKAGYIKRLIRDDIKRITSSN